jgi:hypothetical protein
VLVKRPATRKRARGRAPGARRISGTSPTHDAMEAELADLRGKRVSPPITQSADIARKKHKQVGDWRRSRTLITAVVE